MSQRKFPPSFWNSNYYAPGTFYSDFQFPSGHYPTSSIPGFSGLQDSWFSRLSSQSHTFHHRPMHYDFPYSSMGAGRYNSNFSSFLLQSARSGHFTGSDYGKATDTKFRYPDYRLGADYPGQNTFPGKHCKKTFSHSFLNLFATNPIFSHPWRICLLKTLLEKDKMPEANIFSFSKSVYCQIYCLQIFLMFGKRLN